MLPPGLKSPHEVVLYYDQVYYDLLKSGKAHPYLYPQGALGAFVVLLYLLIDYRHSRLRKIGTFVAYGAFSMLQTWCIITNRARNPAAAFGLGLISSFAMLWVGAILIANDCQRDFRRIERTEDGEPFIDDFHKIQRNVITASGYGNIPIRNGDLRPRRNDAMSQDTGNKDSSEYHGSLYWQPYPDSLRDRLDWVADVFCSLRGVGWNWQTSGIPPPPKWVEAQLRGERAMKDQYEPPQISRVGIRRFNDRRALIKECAICLAVGYVALDGIKTLGIHDLYMWGYMDAPPPEFLPSVVRNSFVLTKSYRLLVSLAAIYTALWTIFKMGPVFFCGILGPKVIGIRGEAFMNPADMFGNFTSILDNGLAGWWGAWWHQTFRFVFEQPAIKTMDYLGLDRRSATGKIISVFTAFFLSGCLHASGSYTQLGDTRPLWGPMRFFLLQACGITVQTFLVQGLKAAGVMQRLPRTAKRAGNFILVHIWLYHTAPLLTDDFSRGGIWLFEPIPISIFRGLGFGPEGEGWWCWWNDVVRWKSGDHWWDTGIAV